MYNRSSSEMLAEVLRYHGNFASTCCSGLRGPFRVAMGIDPAAAVVIYGEQPYMVGGCPKVLAKRFLVENLRSIGSGSGLLPLEMFASFDSAVSEPDIYRAILPSPAKDGRRGIGVPTRTISQDITVFGVQVSAADIARILANIEDHYHSIRKHSHLDEALALIPVMEGNLAYFNIAALHKITEALGLRSDRTVFDGEFESAVALVGGLEYILDRWDEMRRLINEYNGGQVRPLGEADAPIWLHEGSRRLRVEYHDQRFRFNSHEMTLTELLDLVRGGTYQVTYKAIPRVLIYSILADGHISGGGSTYNEVASRVAQSMGLPYFPLMTLGSRLFNYDSVVFAKLKRPESGLCPFQVGLDLVAGNKVATLDLIASHGSDRVREAVLEFVSRPDIRVGESIEIRK